MSVDRTEEIASGDEAEAGTTAATSATETALRYYTTAPSALNVRGGPGTSYKIIRVLAGSSRVPIFCQTPGETITGPYGTTRIWDNIGNGEYVSDAFVKTGSDGYVAGRCS